MTSAENNSSYDFKATNGFTLMETQNKFHKSIHEKIMIKKTDFVKELQLIIFRKGNSWENIFKGLSGSVAWFQWIYQTCIKS